MKPFVLLAAVAGPVMINVLGYDVPVLAAITSVLGVVLASLIAKPPALGLIQRIALIALLCILTLALVISDPQRSLIVSTCWAICIGYTGLPVIQAIQARLLPQAGDLASGGTAAGGLADPPTKDPSDAA